MGHSQSKNHNKSSSSVSKRINTQDKSEVAETSASIAHDARRGKVRSRSISAFDARKETIPVRRRSHSSTRVSRKAKDDDRTPSDSTRDFHAENLSSVGQVNTEPADTFSDGANSSGISYERTQGQNTNKGGQYEVVIIALLFLRLKNSEIISDFHLATNVAKIAPLDDIMVKFKLTGSQSSEWQTCFVQIKHKQTAHLKDEWFIKRKDGDLGKFVKSKESIKGFMECSPQGPLFNGCDIRNCQFVFYTNAKPAPEFADRSKSNILGILGTFLRSISNQGLIFNLNEDEKCDKAIFDDINKNEGSQEVKDFLTNFIICCGQPSVEEMEEIVKSCLLKETKMGKNDIELLFRCYKDAITKWWENGTQALNRDSRIFDKTLADFKMSQLSSQNMKQFFFKTIKFQDVYLLEKKPLHHICHSLLRTKLCCTRLKKTLQNVKKGYILLTLEYLLIKRDKVLLAWSEKDVLVIVSEPSDKHEDIEDMGNALCQHLQKHNDKNCVKKIIVVSAKNDKFTLNLKEKLGGKCNEIVDIFEISHLKPASKKMIENTRVSFQGGSVTLGELLKCEDGLAEGVFNDDLFEKVDAHEPISLLDTPKLQLEENNPHYIPRTLERCETLSVDILAAKSLQDVFIVHDITEHKLQDLIPPGEKVGHVADYSKNPCRYLVVKSGESEGQIHALKSDKTVHELRMCSNNSLKWILTKGNIQCLHKFINQNTPDKYNDHKKLPDLCESVILILSEAGMGKSTFLTHLSLEIKKANPTFLVIRVNLKDHLDELQASGKDAIEFIASAVGISKSPTEKALFVSMMNDRRCVVLLDGFDEVAPDCTARGLLLLTSLRKYKVKKIVVTSRHTVKGANLEKYLSTLKFTLQQFDEEHQRMLFVKFWRRNEQSARHMDTGTAHQREQLIGPLLRMIPKDGEKEFMGTPLLTMLLAEIYEDNVKDETRPLPQKLNMVQMLKQVVDKKLKLDLSKVNLDKNKNIRHITDPHFQAFIDNHMDASLLVLLGIERIELLYNGHLINEKIKNMMDTLTERECKAGIIVKVENNKPIFLHRTFAEYFTALWFCINWRDNRKFLQDYLFTDEFRVIRQMFDLMLASDSALLEAVVLNDMAQVKQLVSRENINSMDLGGRTTLHLGAVLRTDDHYHYIDSEKMVQLFLEHETDEFKPDDVLGWNVLEYAIYSESWRIVEYLNRRITCQRTKSRASVSSSEHNGSRTVQRKTTWIGYEYDCIKGNNTLLPTLCAQGNLAAAEELITSLEDNLKYMYQINHKSSHMLSSSTENSTRANLINSEQLKSVPIAVKKYVNAVDHEGSFALHYASTNGFEDEDADLITLLITKGADPWTLNAKEQSPLHCYCELTNKHVDSISALIANLKGEKLVEYINLKDSNGMTSLHYSAQKREPNVIKFLIGQGGNIWTLNNQKKSPLHLICSSDNCNVNVASAIIKALNGNCEEYVKMKDSFGMSSLQYATSGGNSEVMDLLISEGGDFWELNERGQTLLMINCESQYCNDHAITTLVGRLEGNDWAKFVNVRDVNGMSAKMLAKSHGNAFVVDLLNSLKQSNVC